MNCVQRLGELLLEAVAWAGGLEGDLGEAGKQVLRENIQELVFFH